jgi:uncharacterized membrane protein
MFFEPLSGILPLLLLALILGGGYLLARRRGASPFGWLARRSSPEAEAKRILSARLAQGDISSEEFLERASTLNWTPGMEPPDRRRLKRE